MAAATRTVELPSGEALTFDEVGDWTDEPCYYVSVMDGPKVGLLAGPFRTYQEALDIKDRACDLACKVNDWAWFYSFGTVKMANGHHRGALNEDLGL